MEIPDLVVSRAQVFTVLFIFYETGDKGDGILCPIRKGLVVELKDLRKKHLPLFSAYMKTFLFIFTKDVGHGRQDVYL